jgi:cytochrome d ubiquinol oxidase subunit II
MRPPVDRHCPHLGFLGMAMAIRGLRAGREVSTLLWSKMASSA